MTILDSGIGKLAVLFIILALALGCATETVLDSAETPQSLEATAAPLPTYTSYPTYTPYATLTALPRRR